MSETTMNPGDGWEQVDVERWRKNYGGGVRGEVYAVAAGIYTGGTLSAWLKFAKALDSNYGGHRVGLVQACEAVDLMYAAEFAASIDGNGWRHVEADKWHKDFGNEVFGEVTVMRPGLFDGRMFSPVPPGYEIGIPDLCAGMNSLCRAMDSVEALHREYQTEGAW